MDPKAILAWLADKLGINDDGGAGEGDVEPDAIRDGDEPAPDAENVPDDGTDDGTDGDESNDIEGGDVVNVPAFVLSNGKACPCSARIRR